MTQFKYKISNFWPTKKKIVWKGKTLRKYAKFSSRDLFDVIFFSNKF